MNLVIPERRSIKRTKDRGTNNATVDGRPNVMKEIETEALAKKKDFLCWSECYIGPK